MPGKPDDRSASAAAGRSRTFRLFVSSTFEDLKAERNALHAHVFPRLRELCRRHGCRFQAIDLRWGVSEEASLDQRTMNICLGEIERCLKTTPRPNFLVLLGQRYGWCPPAPQIPAREFDGILAQMARRNRCVRLLQRWYRRDDNAVPPEYRLQPRRIQVGEGASEAGKRAAGEAEREGWRNRIEPRLHAILAAGARGLDLDAERRRVYRASATEQEIAAGALSVPDPEGKVFCFFRTIEGARDHDGTLLDGAERFIDADPASLDALKAELRGKLARRPEAVKEYTAQWTGEGPSTDHVGTLPEDLDECLARLDATEDDRPH